MPDYRKLYLLSAGAIADAVELLHKAQLEAEELYVEDEKDPVQLSEHLPADPDEPKE